jgi:hypothetical protein
LTFISMSALLNGIIFNFIIVCNKTIIIEKIATNVRIGYIESVVILLVMEVIKESHQIYQQIKCLRHFWRCVVLLTAISVSMNVLK